MGKGRDARRVDHGEIPLVCAFAARDRAKDAVDRLPQGKGTCERRRGFARAMRSVREQLFRLRLRQNASVDAPTDEIGEAVQVFLRLRTNSIVNRVGEVKTGRIAKQAGESLAWSWLKRVFPWRCQQRLLSPNVTTHHRLTGCIVRAMVLPVYCTLLVTANKGTQLMAAKGTGAATRANWSSDFRRLWAALTVALFGTQIATLALPLTAALTLGASPLQMGMLATAGQLPFLLCSLPLGVWVDRAARRRPLLVAADLGRGLVLAVVPLAAFLGALRIELLYATALLAGCLSVLFDIAHMSYVPALVGRERLTASNSKIQISYSTAESAGPGLAGILIQLVTAPFAMIGAASAFLASALLLASIKQPEDARNGHPPHEGFRKEVTDGLRALLGHPLLRPIALTSGAATFFIEGARALYVLFAARELGLSATAIGVILVAGGATAVPGAMLAGRAANRFGFGTAVFCGWLIEGAALLLIPLAAGPLAILILAGAQAIGGFAGAIANVNQWSLRQIVTPDHLQGRVTASHRCVVYGAGAMGALGAGVLASAFGMRPALLACAAGASLAPLTLLLSPLHALSSAPSGPTEIPEWSPAD